MFNIKKIIRSLIVLMFIFLLNGPSFTEAMSSEPIFDSLKWTEDYIEWDKEVAVIGQPLKVWTIKFNNIVHPATEFDKYIFIEDSSGNELPCYIGVNMDSIFVAPLEQYIKNEIYTLYIKKGIRSGNGELSQTSILKQFKLEYGDLPIEEFLPEVYEKAENIIEENINDNMTDYQKIKVLYDYIRSNTISAFERYPQENTFPRKFYSAEGVLLEGVGFSSGYSSAFKLLCDILGIECIEISNLSNNEKWNIVKLEDEYYHLDAYLKPNRLGIAYDYFLRDDEFMSFVYRWDKGEYPKCNSYFLLENEYDELKGKDITISGSINFLSPIEEDTEIIVKAYYGKKLPV